MNVSEFIIHIGTHKTGTTAIQNYLQANSRTLLRQGVLYIPHPQGHSALKNSDTLDETAASRYRQYVSTTINDTGRTGDKPLKVLLSWEGFSGSLIAGYTNAQAVVDNLQSAVSPLAERARIIVYLRRQDHFLESVYSQKVHSGMTDRFESFLNKLPEDAFNWDLFLQAYESKFGFDNVVPRIYDRRNLATPSQHIEDFSQLTDIADSAVPDDKSDAFSKVANTGYAPEALEALRLCNQVLSEEERVRVRRILKKYAPKKSDYGSAFWTNSLQQRIASQHQEGNIAVANRYPQLADGLQFDRSEIQDHDGSSIHSTAEAVSCLASALLAQLDERPRPLHKKVLRRLFSQLNSRSR